MPDRFPCPCCGYQTLPQPAPGSWEICPVCGWEDAPDEQWGWRSNAVSLKQAQQNFLRLGACEPDWVSDVRPPDPQESRLPSWQPLKVQEEQQRSALIQAITQAFACVQREDGVSLHQARVIDAYGGAAAEAEARQLDIDNHWWEVPDAWLAEYSEILNFVDAKGFQYYLPAFMIWSIQQYEQTTSFSVDATIYSLHTYAGLRDWKQAYFAILTDEQRRAIAHFLHYMACWGGDRVDTAMAQAALQQYWGQFVSPHQGDG